MSMDFRTFDLRKRVLEDVGNKFYPWMLKARQLILSASILENQCAKRKYFGVDLDKYEDELEAKSPSVEVHSVILMLWAMAAECLLKALWLKSGEKLIRDGNYNKIPDTNDHHLDTIAHAVCKKGIFKFTIKDLELLFRLSGYIIHGRYPIPKHAHTRTAVMPDGRLLKSELIWHIRSDDKQYHSLVARMWKALAK